LLDLVGERRLNEGCYLRLGCSEPLRELEGAGERWSNILTWLGCRESYPGAWDLGLRRFR
jgi:hypothetical protein